MAKRNVEKMGKTELRAACKAAGISYGKLTVQGMRDALMTAHAKAAPVYDERNGPEESAPAAAVTTAAPQVEREVRNGVKRPRAGGLCAAVWEALDQLHAAGVLPTGKDARDLATAKGWNTNNATAELSAWRKFMGLSKPRVTKPKRKTAAKTAAPAVLTEEATAS